MASNSFVSSDLYEFGPFRLDVRARVLSKEGEPLPLAPKSFDVLVHLVRNAGRAVTREELLSTVWPDVVVGDGTLTQAVFVVRRALGETDEGARFLVTVPRVGYRFSDEAGPVPSGESEAVTTSAEASPAPGEGRRRALLAGACVVVLALAVVAAMLLKKERAPTDVNVRSAPAPLLSVVREIAVPPDATALLGGVEGTIVLGAPSAVYLLPVDGAQAATRIALGEREVLANRLAGGDLIVARGRALVARHAVKQTTRALGDLPDGVSPLENRFFVSPSGRYLAVREPDGIRVFSVGGGRVAALFRVASTQSDYGAIALSDRWLAVAEGRGTPISAYRLPSGEKAFEAPFAETHVTALALEDVSDRLAVGGAFDTVSVLSLGGGAPETRHARGWTRGLAFVPDFPTLLASGRLGAVAVRPGAGAVAAIDAPLNGGPVAVTAEAVCVLVPERQRLAVLEYSGFPPKERVPLGRAPLWAVEHDADGRTLFAGGRDGILYAVDSARHDVRRATVHADGIPSLLRAGSLLASASDDKTVAVWRLPGPQLVVRRPAHAFLVNDLQIAPNAPGGPWLFTASSDGTVKTWRWPSLEPLETVDLGPFAGGQVEAHALWVAEDAQRALVGTWNNCLLDLRREGGSWTGRRIETDANAVYRFAGLPGLGLVAGVGLHPHEVFLLDLGTGERRRLESASLDAFWIVASPGRNELFVVGSGGALRYRLTRRSGGGVEVSLWSSRQSGLMLLSLTALPDGRLWAGTVDGALVELDSRSFGGAPLGSRIVSFDKIGLIHP